MNGKQARKLRRAVKALGAPKDTKYIEGEKELWGPLPYIQGTRIVDGKELDKRLKGAKNPKWKTILTSRTWYQRFVRYVPGKPTKLDLCERRIYQKLKKEFMVS